MKTEEILAGNKLIAEFNKLGYEIYSSGKIRGSRGKLLKLHIGTSGYYQVNTWRNYKQKTFLVHRLITSAFISNPNNLSEVNHKDGNKLNNNVSNLEWVTRSENINHSISNELISSPWKNKLGKLPPKSKPTLQMDFNNNIIVEYGSAREASRLTGINYGTISNVLIEKGKTAGGYKWKYKQ